MMVGGLCPSPLAGPLLDRTSSSRRFRIVTTAAVGNGKKFSNRVDSFQDYYNVLGISVNASPVEIRKAYRSLQKKHHPDVAGAKGHAMTLLLNEAYQTLMSEELRDIYDSMHLKKSMRFSNTPRSFTGLAYSSWNGPDRDEAVFVDENACIGCPECVFLASKTFAKDESSGRARVCTQWGDEDTQIKAAFEACPVNCIHYVEKCDLPILEYLMRPRPKTSNGIFGGEWERPSNIFMAAKTFKLKLEAEEQSRKSKVPDWKTETLAQRKARRDADLKIRAGVFWRLWSWVSDDFGYGSDHANGKQQEPPAETWPWKGLFGLSSTSQLLQLPVDSAQVPQVVERVQDWATTFASSSELPLPMPFRTDLLENGVQLTLLTVNNGVLESVGSLIVTVDQIPSTREDPVIDIGKDEEPKWWCCIERQGTTGTQSLPGEAVIVRRVRDVVKGTDKSYSNYRIRRS